MSTRLRGKLASDGRRDYTGTPVTASFDERVDTGKPKDEVFAPARRAATAAADGGFELELPDRADRRGPILVQAFGVDGLVAGAATVAEAGPFEDIAVRVAGTTPTTVSESPDITLGQQIKYTGRALDPDGRPVAADLLVVIRATPFAGGAAAPVSVARTAQTGYFSGIWPAERFRDASAVVSGSAAVPIPLVDDRLPLRMILVVTVPPPPVDADEDDCTCEDAPPRAPDAIDLAANPGTFAADAQRCVDFTIPNRTVEEVTYQAVVRTTQPQLKPPFVPGPKIPDTLVTRLAELAQLQLVVDGAADGIADGVAVPVGGRTAATAAVAVRSAASRNVLDAAVDRARRIAPGLDLDRGAATDESIDVLAARVLEARAAARQPLRLESSVVAELAREPGGITARRLLDAEHTSGVRRFRTVAHRLGSVGPDRFTLSDTRQIAWDDFPDAFQATTIAHGHLLTFKQVWRADGYSLGDLLYSLPLAPGQQKLISILDWNRREVTERRAAREVREALEADLTHDRDISDIIRTSLTERMDARSHADVAAGGGALGGFIGPLVFGAAGGVSSAGSTASQTSGRAVTGTALNRLRDRTLQAASAIRTQRSTVVQTARQGESVRAQTEVVVNYNHCHALTVEYFEVLRHLQVSQELAFVQECLFVPFLVTPFNAAKALRWRDPLQRGLRNRSYLWMFDALHRVHTAWADADFPPGRYADEIVRHVEGEFHVTIRLPRPKDDADGLFVQANWDPYVGTTPAENLLWDQAANIHARYLGVALPQDRDRIWDTRIAPGVAQRLLEQMTVQLMEDGGGTTTLTADPTLVDPFVQGRSLLVSLRVAPPIAPAKTRAQIDRLRLALDVNNLPPGAELIVRSGTMRYRTDHFNGDLVANRRILNDLTLGDPVEIATPLTLLEKRDPRKRDLRHADRLLDHLNEHVEHYHRAVWLAMDPNRRYLLLDGFVAPDAGGRSVASVVENRLIGIVGNCLVMPVAPGITLDRTYEFARSTPADLRHLYATGKVPPMRISLPTSGVFAEAVLGKCNSCETVDDTRFWRWEEAPIPDRPTAIGELSTASRRRQPPSLAPDAFPDPLVRLQQAPAAPDPTGLAAAMTALGANNIFRDITGVALNQENAAEALRASVTAAQGFATKAAALAQQKFLNRELDRSVDHIKSARDKKLITDDQAKALTEDVLRGAIGEPRPADQSAIESPAIKRAIERVPKSENGSLRVTRPQGTVEVKTGSGGTTSLDVAVDPAVVPLQQPNRLACWAAGGTMMESWRIGRALTIEEVLDGVGGGWKAIFQAEKGLTLPELRAFLGALRMTEEGPASYTPEGLARLLAAKGPLFEVGDDSVENNKFVHVRIVTAIKGDGTPEGTDVFFADSFTGKIEKETFSAFDRRHAATDVVRFGSGIFHY
jgi:hypothetical protein